MKVEPVTRRRYSKRLEPSERRDSILDSALQLVTRVESFGVTMAQVAEEEGVTKPVIYDHFANIEELLAALFAREGAQTVIDVVAILAARDDSPPGEGRLAFALKRVELFLGLIADRPDQWRLALIPPMGLTPESREQLATGKELVFNSLRDLIAWAVGDMAEYDLELTAHSMQAIAQRMAQLLIEDPVAYPADRSVAFAQEQVALWMVGHDALRAVRALRPTGH